MKHFAMAIGLAAAVATAAAVLSHGEAAVSETETATLVPVQRPASADSVVAEPAFMPSRASAPLQSDLMPAGQLTPAAGTHAAAVESDQGVLRNSVLDIRMECARLDAESWGFNAERSIHTISGWINCDELDELVESADVAAQVEIAALDVQDTAVAAWSANPRAQLRPRHGQALGPMVETFDLLKPGSQPPSSSGSKTTSDYRP